MGEERGSAGLIADSHGIDCWVRSGNRKAGTGRGESQAEESRLEAETC